MQDNNEESRKYSSLSLHQMQSSVKDNVTKSKIQIVYSEKSTSVSDAVLALSAFYAIQRVHEASSNWHLHLLVGTSKIEETPLTSILGFFSIAFAALLGVFRFGLKDPPSLLLRSHKFASWFAGFVGMSLLSINFTFIYQKSTAGWLHLLDVIVVLLANKVLPSHLSVTLEKLQQAAVVLSIVVVSFLHQNWDGVLGAQLVALAGLTIGTEGTIFGMPAVDAFHYTLACALFLLSRGLASVF